MTLAQQEQDNVWDFCQRESNVDRLACKKLIYCILFGGDVASVVNELCLELNDVINIRRAFDEFNTRE